MYCGIEKKFYICGDLPDVEIKLLKRWNKQQLLMGKA